MNYHLTTQYPTPEQKKMNNGMTEEKIRIIRYKLELAEYGRKQGQISSAQCLDLTKIYIHVLMIFQGKKIAYQES